MFLMIGIDQRREDLEYYQQMECDVCGRYGNFNVFMTCMVLYLFFIPVFKWNRRYFVETSCCSSIYELDETKGKMIAKGESTQINDEDLKLVYTSFNDPGDHYKKCSHCGYETWEDFEYCPKCGERFDDNV